MINLSDKNELPEEIQALKALVEEIVAEKTKSKIEFNITAPPNSISLNGVDIAFNTIDKICQKYGDKYDLKINANVKI